MLRDILLWRLSTVETLIEWLHESCDVHVYLALKLIVKRKESSTHAVGKPILFVRYTCVPNWKTHTKYFCIRINIPLYCYIPNKVVFELYSYSQKVNYLCFVKKLHFVPWYHNSTFLCMGESDDHNLCVTRKLSFFQLFVASSQSCCFPEDVCVDSSSWVGVWCLKWKWNIRLVFPFLFSHPHPRRRICAHLWITAQLLK